MNLSGRIKFSRKRLGISQREFAKRLDTSQKVVYRWETGAKPRENGLEKIAKLAGVRLAWLSNDEGEPTDEFKPTLAESRLILYFRKIEGKKQQRVARARMRFAEYYINAEKGIELVIKTDFYSDPEGSRNAISGEMTNLLDEQYGRLCRAYAEFQAVCDEADEFGREKKIADPFQQAYKDIQNDIEEMASADKEWILTKLEEIDEERLERTKKVKAIINRKGT